MAELSRRHLVQGSAAIAGLAVLNASQMARAYPSRPGEEVIAWLDQPPENPVPQVVANQLKWEDVGSQVTPNDKFFSVAHYNRPVIDENVVSTTERGSARGLSPVFGTELERSRRTADRDPAAALSMRGLSVIVRVPSIAASSPVLRTGCGWPA